MGMGGRKNYIYIKEKNFSFFAGSRRKMGGMGGWGGNRFNYGKMKNCKLKR
jgi:hypothetical protein